MASGLFVLTGAWEPTSELVRLYGVVMFWPGSDEVEISKEANLLSAILGGVMFSWGFVYWQLTNLLELDPGRIKQIFTLSIWAWFVTDSLGSMAAGGWINLICNVGYLLIFVVPLRNVATSSSR